MLQQRLNVKISQRQVLTPGLVQMVSVLALNKLELREMINGELVENPVLEEIDPVTETLDDRSAREGDRERTAEQQLADTDRKDSDPADPFDEIDFGSYFQDYLDPGFRTASSNFEALDDPGFENFISKPSTLSDHLLWQLGAITLSPEVRTAAELIVGNLNEDGYLTATDEDLLASMPAYSTPEESLANIREAHEAVAELDPLGIGARDLRECLLRQLQSFPSTDLRPLAVLIVDQYLQLLQKRDTRELIRLCRQPAEAVAAAVEVIRRLDPRPGQRYHNADTRLIEPDVAFVKRGEDFVVVMNEEDLPTLRLNSGYRKMLRTKTTERDVREYVKERYKSAIQLLRNLDQRKNTILRTCETIVRRQQDFLERGVEGLRPMMIKDVAEEIGVHPSTVSRAVANKYVHTAQGVYELRFFFSEGGNGPEGGDLPLVLLKRRVKKLIDEEDPRTPWTDEALAAELQRHGIKVTRRTVAKYREDLQIPSTHQRRQR